MLYLYDDMRARAFEPFASSRPISELTAGIALVRERWTMALGADGGAHCLAGARHEHFDESYATGASRPARGTIPAGSIIANSRCAPALPPKAIALTDSRSDAQAWQVGDRIGAVRTGEPVEVNAFDQGALALGDLLPRTARVERLDGWWLDDVWDFLRLLPEQLSRDIASVAERQAAHVRGAPPHVTTIGGDRVLLLGDATIEPHVVFDTFNGPILVEAGAHVHAFTRINGPCRIGPAVTILGGDISACSIGEVSKVRGEMTNTIIVGHSNKGHDGFVGHSYLGRWVNLGAGTITSNLKNTYGPVSLWTPSGTRDTGMQFLGTLFGDHVKTGIGLRLTTGTVLGAGANVYGNMPPNVVAPFSWGDAPPYASYRADKFVETAARMMTRRHVELTDRARRHLEAMHAGRWTVDAETSHS
jgi:UDP-N-acetylglucosamine diphosphorylase/glucosamine-1-phosphate N-acetyltransferase